MKRIILAIMFFFFFSSFLSLNAQWARTYGGSNSDEAESIQQTSDGGYIVAGGTDSFGAGENDIWVLKLSSMGEIEWQKTYGGSGDDFAHSIQQTSDGGYIVAGSREGDFWVLKLSPDGEIEWQKTYGGIGDDFAHSIQQTSDGGYIVAGDIGLFSGGYGAWVLKLSSTGDIEWKKTYAGTFETPSIQQTSDGGYIVAGRAYFDSGYPDFWILKLSSTGEIEWQKTYGGSDSDGASSIQQTGDGGYIVIGETSSFGAGFSDFWIFKLSPDGEIEWQKTYGGSGWDQIPSIQQTSDGGYIVAGNDHGGGGYGDFWILKLSPDGEIEWQKTYGGSGDDFAHSIQQTSDGGYIVAGYTMSWGAGSYDFLVLKLSSDGIINPRCSFIRSSNAEVSDTDISPVVTNTTPGDKDITSQDTNIIPQDTDATVYNLCSEKPLLSILTYAKGIYNPFTTEKGTTDPAPGTYIYDLGAEVTITATPIYGYYFYGWSGDASGETNPITIIMDSDKSIIAHFWPIPTGDGDDTGKKGGCFIATAAYSSPLHPHVEILRDFREKYLTPFKLGRKIVDIYYKYSPFVANIIEKHKALKVMVRISLLPFIVISYSILHFGPIITTAALIFIFMLPAFSVWRYQRKLRRHMRGEK
jgi:uncharacterized delta-60 repeat protein/uncharacterized repeat protein (TIGR02543 family)